MVNKKFHFLFGIHSGIPLCCIDFFINVWDARELYRQDRPLVKAIHASEVRYVQCPSCLRHKRAARLRRCGEECWTNCVAAFRLLSKDDSLA